MSWAFNIQHFFHCKIPDVNQYLKYKSEWLVVEQTGDYLGIEMGGNSDVF